MQNQNLLRYILATDKRAVVVLLILMLLQAAFDVIGVASIYPLVSVLTNPESIENSATISKFYEYIGAGDTSHFAILLGTAALIINLLGNLVKSFASYFQFKFVYTMEYKLGLDLLRRYLHISYEEFITENSSQYSKNIFTEANQVINGRVLTFIQLVTHSTIAIFIFILLLAADPFSTAITGCLIGGMYTLIYLLFKPALERASKGRVRGNHRRFFFLTEAFSGFKALKANSMESSYISKYKTPAKDYAQHQIVSSTISTIPRYLFEAFAFSAVLFLIFYLVERDGSLNSALPMMTLYIFAFYRLMPSAQQIYRCLSVMKTAKASVDIIERDLNKPPPPFERERAYKQTKEPSSFKSLSLKKVSYSYPGSSKTSLTSVSLDIYPKKIIGIAGETGSGKSTAIDLLIGLLHGHQGKRLLNNNVYDVFQQSDRSLYFGFVPQKIFLADDTLAANIAMDAKNGSIDVDLLNKVIELTQLDILVRNELENGVNSQLGENGIRLSGGQRQRVGIARALYKKPSVLILDEATSALDPVTEKKVLSSIKNHHPEMAIVMVTHRLQPLQICDFIYLFKNGRIIQSGNYEELCAESNNLEEIFGKI